jgi:hypothetical protein
VKKEKYLKSFTLHVEGREVYDRAAADALEAELKPLAKAEVISRLKKYDTDPAHNPQPPHRREDRRRLRRGGGEPGAYFANAASSPNSPPSRPAHTTIRSIRSRGSSPGRSARRRPEPWNAEAIPAHPAGDAGK